MAHPLCERYVFNVAKTLVYYNNSAQQALHFPLKNAIPRSGENVKMLLLVRLHLLVNRLKLYLQHAHYIEHVKDILNVISTLSRSIKCLKDLLKLIKHVNISKYLPS